MDGAQPLWVSITGLDCPYCEKAAFCTQLEPLSFQLTLVFSRSPAMSHCEELGSIGLTRVAEAALLLVDLPEIFSSPG